jgi:hypothetical protein
VKRGAFISIVGVDVEDTGAGEFPRKLLAPALDALRQHAERHNARLYNRRLVSSAGVVSLEFDMHERP